MNKSALVNTILAQYQQERTRALREADERRAEIAEKAPVYADMEARLRKAIRESATNIAGDPDAGRKAVYAMKAECEKQLRAAGFTPGDLRPRFKCEICGDTGFVGGPVKDFCECFVKRLNLIQMGGEDLNIPERNSFENFDLNTFPEESEGVEQRKQMRVARNWSQQYADGFSADENRSILITGESGLGKTFLLDCITKRIVERGFSAAKFSAYRLGEIMRRKHMGADDGKFDLCLNIDFLAIDDLGSEPMLENVTVEYLYIIISERQQRGKPFIIATNLTMNQLKARYTERLFSRIASKTNPVVILKGRDVRLKS